MKYVILSFDDGAKDFYSCALDILKKYNLTAVLNIVSNKITMNDPEMISWEEVGECEKYGIEIANHSANHTNELEDIKIGTKEIQINLNTLDAIGFASPNSDVCEENFDIYKELLESDETLYIRSGNQLKRDGYFHALLYLMYKYTSCEKIFYWYNKRNIIKLNQKTIRFFPSVTCNNDNTMSQIVHFIGKMSNNTACIIMLHHILKKGDRGYKKLKWSNTVEDFEFLCKYLSEDKTISVIDNKTLCELINNSK